MKATLTKRKSPAKTKDKENSFPVVAIGASAGGLEAMMELLKYLPVDTGMAFIYVQHFSPDHKSTLTEILSKKTSMIVQEIDDMDKIRPDTVFVFPYNKGIEVTDGHLKLIPRSESSPVITIDILFSSIAEAQKERVIGIILSGSARDGTVGMKAIKQQGGLTFAQDDTALFTSMPHAAIAAGMVDFILSPKEMALELARLSKQEVLTEELQSANEEVVSSNEELQTVNQELETSKEEIESANEELTTTNQELQTRNDLLNESYDFSEAVIATMHSPMIVLDKSLRVKTANKAFYKNFKVNPEETQGVLLYDLGNKQWNIPRLRELLEDILPKNTHFYDFEITHTFPFIGERVLLLNASRIIQKRHGEELILLSINDVTEVRKKALELLGAENKYLSRYRHLLLQTPVAMAIYRGNNYIAELVNDLALEIINKDKNLIGKPLFQSMPELESQLKPAFDKVLQSGIPFHANEFEATLLRNGKNEKTYFNTIFEPIREDDNTISGVLVVANEITEQVLSRKIIEASDKRYNMMVMQSPFAFAVLKGKDMVVTLANDSIKEMWGKGNKIEGKPLIEVLPELKGQGFMELLDGVYTTGIPYTAYEILAQLKRHGKMEDVYFNFVYQPYRETDDTISGVTIIAIEVTNEVIAKQKIKDSQQQLQNIFMQAPFALNIYEGKELVISLANKLFCEIIGKTESEILGKKLFDAFPETATQGLDKILSDIFSTGIPFKGNEFPVHFLKHGNEFKGYFDFIYQPIFDYNKNVSGVINVAIDVTDKVLARKKIEESDKRYNLILMKSPFAFAVLIGKNMVITLANDSVKEMWGKGKDLEGKSLFDVIPELKDSEFPGLLDKVYTTGTPFYGEEVLAPLLRNGKQEDVYFNFVYQPYLEADETISGVTIIAYEVTAQVTVKKALAAQHEAETNALKLVEETNKRYYSMLMESPFAFTFMKGKDLVVTLANDSMKQFWGKGNEVEGKPLLQVLPELKDQPFPAMLDNVYTTGIPVYANEILARLQHKDKMEERYFNIVYQPDHDADGTISGVITIAYEVSEMVLARRKIEESKEQFQAAIAAVEGILWTNNVKGEMVGEQLGWSSLTGQNYDEYQGYGWANAIHPDDAQPTIEAWNKAVANQSTFEFEHRLNTKQDGWKIFSVKAVPVFDENGTIQQWVGVHTDITERKQQQQILAESEERFRSLADNVPMHIFIIEPNADASISYFNKYWLDYTGQTIEEALGRTWDGIVHPDDVQIIMDVYVPAVEKQQAYTLPAVRVKRYDGAYRWFQVHANPRYLPNGEYMGFIGAGFDIHESKLAVNALKESEEHFRLMADLMPAKISNADAAGNVTYFNKHWLDFSGYTFEELRDFGYQKIMHPDELEEFQQRLQKAAETGTDSVMEMRFKNRQGDYIWHLNIASPVKDINGDLKMWVGVTTEMQHQKKQREGLEQAVAERTLALSAANEGLEEKNIALQNMNKELEAFTYVSSHDLQEPLRKIRTMAGRILEKENQNLSDIGKNYFHIMENAAERMQTLIQDLLAFSRLSMADRKFENTNLNIIIEEVKKEFKEAIVEKNATIEVKEICDIKIIPFQFRQLMHNLIGNALKFSNPKIPPHIILKCQNIKPGKLHIPNLQPQKEYCHISISDNGIGFEKEYAEKIFEVFQKLHGKDEYAGTGIGLAIVKKIVDNHNGIITATSKLNKGTTFDIYIPAI